MISEGVGRIFTMRIESKLKKIVELFLYRILFRGEDSFNGLLVVTYHRVTGKCDTSDSMQVSVDEFEKELLFYKKNFSIINSRQLLSRIETGRGWERGTCLITFDDGWMDNYNYAYPLLKKYDIPAIIFLSTNYMGSLKTFWFQNLDNILSFAKDELSLGLQNLLVRLLPKELPCDADDFLADFFNSDSKKLSRSRMALFIECLKVLPQSIIDSFIVSLVAVTGEINNVLHLPLTWQQVVEMSENGIEFGSHTKNHAILTSLSKNSMKEELLDSKFIIEQRLGKPVLFFSYPNGNFNQEVARAVADCGYKAAFTCIQGINSNEYSLTPFELKRKHIREHTSWGLRECFSDMFFGAALSGVRRLVERGGT